MYARRGAPQTRGFTLVELLIVVAVISLLSAVALPRYLRGTNASQAAANGVASGASSVEVATISICTLCPAITQTSAASSVAEDPGTPVTVSLVLKDNFYVLQTSIGGVFPQTVTMKTRLLPGMTGEAFTNAWTAALDKYPKTLLRLAIEQIRAALDDDDSDD